MDKPFEQADIESAMFGFLTRYHWSKLFVVSNERDMFTLYEKINTRPKLERSRFTPFMRGMRDDGSVLMLASSTNTTGKSVTLRD